MTKQKKNENKHCCDISALSLYLCKRIDKKMKFVHKKLKMLHFSDKQAKINVSQTETLLKPLKQIISDKNFEEIVSQMAKKKDEKNYKNF